MYALPQDRRLPDPVTHAEFYSGVAMKRGLAWVIDTILIALVVGLVVMLTLGVSLFILPLLYLTVGFFYRIFTLAGSSATPGMRLMNIEFLTREGERFDFAHAFLHTLGYTLSMGTLLVQILSVFLMLTSARGQGLTDHILGTVAINRG